MPFQLHSSRSLGRKLLIAVIIDILVLSVLIVWVIIEPKISFILIGVIPALFVINLCLAVVARFIAPKFYFTLLLNAIISSAVFYGLNISRIWYYDRHNFDRWLFTADNKHYELVLKKSDSSYSIFELHRSSSQIFMSAGYTLNNDTIKLTDVVSPVTIYKDTLRGFITEKIALKKE